MDLGELLVKRDKVSSQNLSRARIWQRESGEKLPKLLILLGMVNEQDMAEVLAEHYKLPLVKANKYPTEPALEHEEIPPRFLLRAQVMPIYVEEDYIVLAMADPSEVSAIAAIRVASGKRVLPRVGVATDIEKACQSLYGVEPEEPMLLEDTAPQTQARVIAESAIPAAKPSLSMIHPALPILEPDLPTAEPEQTLQTQTRTSSPVYEQESDADASTAALLAANAETQIIEAHPQSLAKQPAAPTQPTTRQRRYYDGSRTISPVFMTAIAASIVAIVGGGIFALKLFLDSSDRPTQPIVANVTVNPRPNTGGLSVNPANLSQGSVQATVTVLDNQLGVNSSAEEDGRIIRVGPGQPYQTPAQAALVAPAGAIIEIAAAEYPPEVVIWRQSELTVRGINGQPHIKAPSQGLGDDAIWRFTGDKVTVENFKFSGARGRANSGAGVRFEGADLVIRNCRFFDNEMGLLTVDNPRSEVRIENTQMTGLSPTEGGAQKTGYNVYIGTARRFLLRNSYLHAVSGGANVSSRASKNFILYNRVMDETARSKLLLEIEFGSAYIVGNLFQQSSNSLDEALVSFSAADAATVNGVVGQTQQALYMVNNTFVNEDSKGIFVNNRSTAAVLLVNNIFSGDGEILAGPGEKRNNLATNDPGLNNPSQYDYTLAADSAAINKGVNPGRAIYGFDLMPSYQYAYPNELAFRPRDERLDIGAFELIAR